MTALGAGLGLLVGLCLGLLGGGGSTLTVPIFVYVLGLEAKVAIASSLAVVGLTSLVGALRHRPEGQLRLRIALGFGAVAMIGAYLGARIAAFVPGAVQLVLFGTVLLVAAVLMFRDARRNGGAGRQEAPAPGETWPGAIPASRRRRRITTDELLERPRRMVAVGVTAVGVGMLTGLVGVGGGFMIVPALVLLLGMPMKEAVGTSLLVIFMNAAAGFAGYVGQVDLPWTLMGLFALFSIVGIFVGVHLVRHVSSLALRRGFAVFLTLIALLMLWENRGVLI